MLKYQWKVGSRFPVSAQKAGEALDAIRKTGGGRVEPQAVVDASRRKDAPLHPCFTWDDKQAAEKFRQDEARRVIYCLYAVEESEPDDKQPSLVYVHVGQEDGGACYMTTAHVLSDKELREQALAEALAVLNGFQRRYAHLKELSEVFRAIESLNGQKKGKAKRKAAKVRV
jgi:hypothetical protein